MNCSNSENRRFASATAYRRNLADPYVSRSGAGASEIAVGQDEAVGEDVHMDERCGICDRPVVKVGDRWFHADTTTEDHAAVWLNEDHPADPWIETD
jgi:hypothetical protein